MDLFEILPWIIGGGSTGVVGLFGWFMYKLDPNGWKADARRLSRAIRSRITSGRAVKALEQQTRNFDKELEADWTAQFEGKERPIGVIEMPVANVVSPNVEAVKKRLAARELPVDPIEKALAKLRANPKHEIVKKGYYKTHLGPWPEYKCKCGVSGHRAVLRQYGGMEEAQRHLDKEATAHVNSMNKSEETMLRNKMTSKGDFAW